MIIGSQINSATNARIGPAMCLLPMNHMAINDIAEANSCKQIAIKPAYGTLGARLPQEA